MFNSDIKKNIFANGQSILRSIVEHYESRGIDFEESNHMFMSLIANVAEGKVEGSFDEDEGITKWTLTDSYRKLLEEQRENLKNVVRGPW